MLFRFGYYILVGVCYAAKGPSDFNLYYTVPLVQGRVFSCSALALQYYTNI